MNDLSARDDLKFNQRNHKRQVNGNVVYRYYMFLLNGVHLCFSENRFVMLKINAFSQRDPVCSA